MLEPQSADRMPPIWSVGALCHAIADALDARFNPVTVRGEVSGFSRAASGHCYFSLKDESGQLRCAMFRRAASLLEFSPRDGELVEVRARLGVYEPRGDLQLIVESMGRTGAGALFEQFLKLKARLEVEGLFDPAAKRSIPLLPRGIGVVTSRGAAALHDVMTTLQRRAPHIPVLLAPALVQGSNAAAGIIKALSSLYLLTQAGRELESNSTETLGRQVLLAAPVIDVILLVRGGGSIEDLWAFNDEQLARTLARSPVPVVCGVGHETDFTIADFVADLRAPTPTAAAELVAKTREVWCDRLDTAARRLQEASMRQLERQQQRLDAALARLGRPSSRVAQQQLRLASQAQRLATASRHFLQQRQQVLQTVEASFPAALQRGLAQQQERLQRAALRLGLLDPSLVLQRGYAWLSSEQGLTVSSVRQTHAGQALRATLADGTLDLTVSPRV